MFESSSRAPAATCCYCLACNSSCYFYTIRSWISCSRLTFKFSGADPRLTFLKICFFPVFVFSRNTFCNSCSILMNDSLMTPSRRCLVLRRLCSFRYLLLICFSTYSSAACLSVVIDLYRSNHTSSESAEMIAEICSRTSTLPTTSLKRLNSKSEQKKTSLEMRFIWMRAFSTFSIRSA